jgi:hypothetical protein
MVTVRGPRTGGDRPELADLASAAEIGLGPGECVDIPGNSLKGLVLAAPKSYRKDEMATSLRQLPPHVLAPEVAASARDVIAGRDLTRVGRVALEEARLQLEVERSAIRDARFDRIAALAESQGSSLHLAALALQQLPRPEEPLRRDAQLEFATEQLDRVVADLNALEARDLGAARRVNELFDGIVERVLAPTGVSS